MKNFSSRRHIKIPTPESLAHAALHYLSRYAASEHALRRVLENRLRRAALQNPEFFHDHEVQKVLHQSIDAIIERHKKAGILNDAAYAETKIHSLRRAGRSSRDIERRLSQKGVNQALVRQALNQSDDEQEPMAAERQAALKLATRRKLGPFRAGPTDPARHQKDVATMARAGFSYDIIKNVLGGDIPEEDI